MHGRSPDLSAGLTLLKGGGEGRMEAWPAAQLWESLASPAVPCLEQK